MKKLGILLALVLLASCSLFDKPQVDVEPENIDEQIILNDYLSAQKFEVDGVTYYWVHKTKAYKFYQAHIICPEKDKAIINLSK